MKADLLLQGGAIVDVVEKRCYAGDMLIKDGAYPRHCTLSFCGGGLGDS